MLISTRLDTLGDLLRTNKVGWCFEFRCAALRPEGTRRIASNPPHVSLLFIVLKDTMNTKGVASVRSPVRNLVQSSASATHEGFVDAVIKSFREEYAIDEEVS